jgi:hypothetical protein
MKLLLTEIWIECGNPCGPNADHVYSYPFDPIQDLYFTTEVLLCTRHGISRLPKVKRPFGSKTVRKGSTDFHSRFHHGIPPQLGSMEGRAVAQAVRRWLPTAAARVRVRAACGVCGEQSGIGAGFLRVLRFPLPIIPPISPPS